jgi:hypothetical protein
MKGSIDASCEYPARANQQVALENITAVAVMRKKFITDPGKPLSLPSQYVNVKKNAGKWQ